MMLRHYLRYLCPLFIITSKKMNSETFYQHLQRRRQISNYLSLASRQQFR
jgi:hypothetical protein